MKMINGKGIALPVMYACAVSSRLMTTGLVPWGGSEQQQHPSNSAHLTPSKAIPWRYWMSRVCMWCLKDRRWSTGVAKL